MKHKWLSKLTALILIFAMSLSMAGTALAAGSDSAEPAAYTSESEANTWSDLLPTDEEVSDLENETTDAEGEDEESTDTDPADGSPEEKDPADDSSADSSTPSEGESAPDESAPVEPEDPSDDLEAEEVQETAGWNYTTDEDGETVFYFLYENEDGELVKAANGYFQLPDIHITVVESGDVTTSSEPERTLYQFEAGIYAFNKDGSWKKNVKADTDKVTVTPITDEDGTLVLADSTQKVLSLGAAKETSDEGNVTVSSPIDYFDGKFNDLYYFEGDLYSGLFRFEKGGKLYKITDGVGALFTGTMNSSYKNYICDYVLNSSRDNLYYNSGSLFTGLRSSNLYYYTNGKKDTSLNGWKTIGKKIYYFTKGLAASGEKYITRNGYQYLYTFQKNGALVTDLFKYDSSYKKKKLYIYMSRKSHTGTILAYNSATKTYDIPVKSFVVSMSRLASNTKNGTYKLRVKCRWWKYKTGLWYQYAVHVSGSGSLTHSEQYSSNSIRALKTASYNGLGTDQSKQCIRMQVVNAKLIYDLARTNNSNVRVVLTKSNNGRLPFGQMTLSNKFDRTGKISTKYDPTDPNI
jgi:hypothetical protein